MLLIVDEFSAIAQASQGLVNVVERARGFGVAAVLCPQVAEGMGSSEAAARIIGSAQTILLHATAHPGAARRRRRHPPRPLHHADQLDSDAYTGLGSARLQHEYRVDPNEVRRLQVGQCFAISPGRAMKLQIVPAPTLASLHEQPLPDRVSARSGGLVEATRLAFCCWSRVSCQSALIASITLPAARRLRTVAPPHP